jgi:hypothetical protein
MKRNEQGEATPPMAIINKSIECGVIVKEGEDYPGKEKAARRPPFFSHIMNN